MFIDQAEIYVRSGNGGNGMVHFHREKYVPRGGPDGGDGGKGGDAILKVRKTMNTLSDYRHNQRFVADDGKDGGPNNMSGRNGKDLIIAVPPGTVVFDRDTGELLADLTQPDQEFTVCKGGRGGRGNQHFATSRNQVPRIGEKGEPFEERNLRFELKLIADIGIIGVPNAGKSTYLSVITNAKPKVAPYPFTTIEPNLGVAQIDVETSVVLADIPGLIEGASQGVGLGHDFLRHVQRTRVLIHLLDGLSEDILGDFGQTNAELALFDPNLSKKPQLVAVNKIDQPGVEEKLGDLRIQLKKKGYEMFAISALARTNTRELLLKAFQYLAQTPAIEDEETPMPVYKPKEELSDFEIFRLDGDKWRVSGAAIERTAKMTYFDQPGSLRRFQKLMVALGIEDALRKAGVSNGDTVMIGEFELEWQD